MRRAFIKYAVAAGVGLLSLAPSAEARMGGGFGGHGGGFGGGHMSGFGGHFGGLGAGHFGRFGGGMMGMGPGFRGPGMAPFRGARFNRAATFHGARFNHFRFDHRRNRFIAAPFFGLPLLAAYGSGYYDDCLVRVWTRWGWAWSNSCDSYGYAY